MSEQENKIEFGLSNVHIATSDGKGGWGKPKLIPGAITFSPKAQGEEFKFFADDMPYYVENTDNGYSGDLSMALLPDWFLGEILGYKKAESGAIVEVKNAPKKNFCLLFEGKGDAKRTRFMFVNCAAGKPTEEYKTLEEKRSVRVQNVPVTVSGDGKSGCTKLKIREGQSGYEEFFNAIPDFSKIKLTAIEAEGV